MVNGTYEPFTGDFDGDGHGDVFWYAPGKPADSVWYGRVHGFSSVGTSIAGNYIPVVGDFDGDAHSDILWYAPGSAHDYLRYGKATLFRDGPAININGTYAPVVGDFNGDGRDDIVWVAPEGSDSPVWYGAASGFQNGAAGDVVERPCEQPRRSDRRVGRTVLPSGRRDLRHGRHIRPLVDREGVRHGRRSATARCSSGSVSASTRTAT